MKQPFDVRDAFVILLHAAAWAAATVYLFKHPDFQTFVTWCGFGGTISTAYHWIVIKDSKMEDAPQPPQPPGVPAQ